ncbi:MAG TPA: malto-oligosyltrehalose trehalohydrolase [Oxalicibacterium sp.]|nr:malto-oligosyltrehalose trehalohydrolase [Oxalicibacterium sp.]
MTRRLPVGAEVLTDGGVHFRVWAPKAKRLALAWRQSDAAVNETPMMPEDKGYWSCTLADAVADVSAGIDYGFRLDDGDAIYPDPVSRWQPAGPHALSRVVDPNLFAWTDQAWQGIGAAQRVIYEMHVGTFTPEGSFAAAAEQLPELAALGITIVELMPVAEFDGAFGWGYDGVTLYAPYHHYGTPDDLRRFVDRAHAVGIGVILDVVYNHCGLSGCYLRRFADDYFTDRYECEWGDAINFDGPNAGPTRDYFVGNASYWIDEFHMDGLRLDATQQIFDSSDEHVLAAVARAVRAAARGRSTYIVGENEPQHALLVRNAAAGGYGLDALWNDDFHHSAVVALRGCTDAYFSDYNAAPQSFISTAKYGFLYQGQWYRWQHKRRGMPARDLAPDAFIHFLQNHDQIANSGFGKRLHQNSSPGACRAMTALLLLGPATPMLFQGQEFAASAPFLYFADHNAELAPLVHKGRNEFLHQFPFLAAPETQAYLSVPHARETFMRCKLDLSERCSEHGGHQDVYALHRDLLALRRNDPVLAQAYRGGVDGAVLSAHAFVLRFFAHDGGDRILLINLGEDLVLSPLPEPLLAPPAGCDWQLLWSSEHPRYGGRGIAPVFTDARWRMPGLSALVLAPCDSAQCEPIGKG